MNEYTMHGRLNDIKELYDEVKILLQVREMSFSHETTYKDIDEKIQQKIGELHSHDLLYTYEHEVFKRGELKDREYELQILIEEACHFDLDF